MFHVSCFTFHVFSFDLYQPYRVKLTLYMSRCCVITGKKTGFGNTRSHSLRHTRRQFKANIQKKRIWDPSTGEYKVMKVSTHFLRTLAKRLQEGREINVR